MKRVCLLLVALCLPAITDSAFGLDGGLYTYVDRVETVRDKRAAEQPTTPPPFELTTPLHNITENATETDPDNHVYYRADYRSDSLWMDMEGFTEHTTVNSRLSASSRHAVRVQLKFYFPFYGYNTSFVYVTSGGFLYAGSYPHSYLASSQYIAPLMAGFNPSVDEDSTISYYGNESFFITEWKNLKLDQDTSGKNFSFQAIVFKNGTLVFTYKDLPMPIGNIPSSRHPVKVGLSDAYYHDTWIITGLISRRTIYLYHETMLNFSRVDEASAVVLTPLETCTARRTCTECTKNPPLNFVCAWCPALQRCSDGFDRHRQDWTRRGCDKKNVTVCPANAVTQPPKDQPITEVTSRSSNPGPTATTKFQNICPVDCGPGTCAQYKCICPVGYYGRSCQLHDPGQTEKQTKSSHAGAVVFILFLLAVTVVISAWVIYAYKNPNTPSGLYLIRVTRCYDCKKDGGTSQSYKYEKTADHL